MPRRRTRLWLLARTVLGATGLGLCGLSCGDQEPAGGTETTSAAGSSLRFDTDGIYLDSCHELPSQCQDSTDVHCGDCQYRVRTDPSACTDEQPCADLVLLWAFGGCQGDGVTQLFDRILDAWPGAVTACVQPLWPGEMLATHRHHPSALTRARTAPSASAPATPSTAACPTQVTATTATA